MAKRLVWIGGGLVAVGALLHLTGVLALGGMDQAPAAAGRPPSTPATPVQGDPVAGIELGLREQLLKNDVLSRPPEGAPLAQLKAYDFALEAKEAGADDRAAVRAAAERIWQEVNAERAARSEVRKAQSKEDARLRQEVKREKIARRRLEYPEPPGMREMLPPRAPKPDLGPPLIEEPEGSSKP